MTQQAKLVARLIRKWQKRLLLANWQFDVCVMPEDHPEDTDANSTMATALPSHRYQQSEVSFYPKFFYLDPDEQERTVMHELLHGPANHTKSLIQRRVMKKRVTPEEADDANEQLVEYMTKVVWTAYQRR